MDKELGLLAYLKKYGNTLESDMLDYMVQAFSLSRKDAKTLLNMKINDGSIQCVLHDKLVSKPIYIAQANDPALYVANEVKKISLDIKNKSELKNQRQSNKKDEIM